MPQNNYEENPFFLYEKFLYLWTKISVQSRIVRLTVEHKKNQEGGLGFCWVGDGDNDSELIVGKSQLKQVTSYLL
jgi:hypothetical protein